MFEIIVYFVIFVIIYLVYWICELLIFKYLILFGECLKEEIGMVLFIRGVFLK